MNLSPAYLAEEAFTLTVAVFALACLLLDDLLRWVQRSVRQVIGGAA